MRVEGLLRISVRLIVLICAVTLCACSGAGKPSHEASAGHTASTGAHARRNAHWDYEMAPGGSRSFRYTGSLTTPPCLEEVIWLISVAPLEMSEEQHETIATHMGHNARPVQPVNGRVLSPVRFVEDPAL